jgi:hypothetical protein
VKGAKVVCVDTTAMWSDVAPALPSKGQVYVLSGTRIEPGGLWANALIIGLPNSDHSGSDVGWKLSRFRPAVCERTEAEDVAQFRKLLNVDRREDA